MRLIRFVDDSGSVRSGRDLGDGRAALIEGDMLDARAEALRPTERVVPVARLLAPVSPVNVFCVGLNYRRHATETHAPIPEQPVIFMKPTTAVTDPGAAIRIPRCCTRGDEVDYECELAVIIGRAPDGRTCRDVSEQDALSFVVGYTAANDVSARKWQRHGGGGQWVRGKSFDTFCPLGPAMLTARPLHPGDTDFIADPQALDISTTLDGTTLQSSHTGDMIFPVARLIAFLSMDTALLPGTVILTGTPSGVGFVRQPPVFLRPGSTVTVELQRIGKLTNPVTAA